MIDILLSMQWLDAQFHIGDSCLAADPGGKRVLQITKNAALI
jgi:hypothetical protein